MARHRTAMGKSIDMAGLIARNEKTRAVGNKSVNARGDSIDQQGRVVEATTERVADSYQSMVGTSGAIEGVSQSANPNAPLSPKQLRELASLKSGPIEEKRPAHPLIDEVAKKAPVEEYVAPIEPEIAPIPPVEPEEFVMKPASEAPDTFAPEAVNELHPEEAELAELEEDFDIEAIKAACLENTITPTEDKK
jgi:hypothetical protein|tara:strand:- start:495 stop:1073 length:579 start_codon:yes stop_codon:yes gene_type:complete